MRDPTVYRLESAVLRCDNENQSRSRDLFWWHISIMRKLNFTFVLLLLAPLASFGQQAKVYEWVDENGTLHYGDSIPAEYAELPKQVLNDHGVTVENLEGKKTPEQIEAERLEKERVAAIELQRRADQALLATYLTVDEILMHRDRRVELFQAQSRVTELYLSNLNRRMEKLRDDASHYQPYNEDSEGADDSSAISPKTCA